MSELVWNNLFGQKSLTGRLLESNLAQFNKYDKIND